MFFRYISKYCGNSNRKIYETEPILMLILSMLIYDGILYYFLKMAPLFIIREQAANLLSFVLEQHFVPRLVLKILILDANIISNIS